MDVPFEFEDFSYRYIIGIDLGTTNSAVAYVDRTKEEPERRKVRFLEIPQLVEAGEVGKRSVLPSFLYIPGPYELPPESTALPWDRKRRFVVGEFAREQGAVVPGRLVSSAKSWLCHGGVDRTGAILPWGAGADVEKVSPVEASSRYLEHVREAWNHVIAKGREGFRLEEQLIVLTVPASFDEVARELTVNAAIKAGIPRMVLVEEPLAAFYAWLSIHEADWQESMRPGQLILVCDVGGGTTDFTLVAIREGEKGLRFDRLAVGDHLMLGGDNMDLSLARHLEIELLGQPGQLDSRRWHQLTHQCRKAKELLLGEASARKALQGQAEKAASDIKKAPGGSGLFGAPRALLEKEASSASKILSEAVTISITGSGRKLISDTLKGTLTRKQVEELIIEGFFPFVDSSDAPKGGRRAGLTEWGLPYVQDPAVTRHLAAFWHRHTKLLEQETGRSVLYPDFLLFNGGALTPASIRKRILSVVGKWFRAEAGEGWEPLELENPRPELSVAIGAAYYGMVRLGEGVRVGAGSPRAYFVEVASEAEAGEDARRAVCLVSRGTEEGFETQLDQPAFEVLTNQPVSFDLFSSSTRLGDRLGDVVTLTDEEITALPPIRTVLRYGKKGAAQTLPVKLAVRLTEIGTLELWCQSQQTPHRWQLQFDVRQETELEPSSAAMAGETLDSEIIDRARDLVRAAFETARTPPASSPERLVKDLASVLDLKKEKWPTSLIRKLSDTLLESDRGRSITPQHEARWFNLLGYCLRPGFGDPLDQWRMREVWKIFPQGLEFPRQVQSRSEWWIFWRRVAGGLSAGHQWHIYQQVLPVLRPAEKGKKKATRQITKTMSAQEELEIWMAMANLERLPADTKKELGNLLLQKISKGKPKLQELWALSRIGARVPFYGPLDQVVPSREASAWVNALLDMKIEPGEAFANALVQLARMTGDRERDLPREDRERLARRIEELPHGARLIEVLTHPETTLMGREQEWIFGESLPSGLIISR